MLVLEYARAFLMNLLSIYSSNTRWFKCFPCLILSLCRFNCCPGSSSAGATHGLVSRDTASSGRPPASRKLPPVPLRPPQCAAVPAPRCRTPAPAAPLQIWARLQRFVWLVQLCIYPGSVNFIYLQGATNFLVLQYKQAANKQPRWTTYLIF